jgi:hypothetical protein
MGLTSGISRGAHDTAGARRLHAVSDLGVQHASRTFTALTPHTSPGGEEA